jgi:plasmid maintenance system antidote protein VapI
MTLKEWLESVDLRVSDLANMLKIPQPTVYTWVNGVKGRVITPELKNILKIKKVTKGKVNLKDWPDYE